jgi:hypothetical protein
VNIESENGPKTPGGHPLRVLEGRGDAQKHPHWWKYQDQHAFSWVAKLSETDERLTKCGYQDRVNGDLQDNDVVISRVRLAGGTLGTESCSHNQESGYLDSFFKHVLGRYYTHFRVDPADESTNGQVVGDYPKALPDRVVWTIKNLPDDTVVLLQSCAMPEESARPAEPARTLFRLGTHGRNDLTVHISNLPDRNVLSTAGPRLEHFRWFYTLLDLEDGNCSVLCSKGDIRLPMPEPAESVEATSIWGVTSDSVHCPPGSP